MDKDVGSTRTHMHNHGPNGNETLNKRPELAMPAGSLQCALYAFKGGADAVYLGLKEFSARKGAVNFTFEDARKLKQLCLSQNKKFYVTLNTLVKDDEIPDVQRLLKQLEYLKPNGVIVQDLGIARLMRTKFPSLPLHGSTQLAVHTVQGVKALQNMGFTRIVLSRELSFKEVERIRKACPDIELKVFIHGALCYGFSGLCMASECITGRSANRGECAQICRTWFSRNEGSKEQQSWLFSMKDLCLGELVREYTNIGIDSLKVEGRMKSSEYVYRCARYYSLLLDGKDEDDVEVKNAKQAMQTAFSRETTAGFFHMPEREPLTCTDYPSHRGIRVGSIERVMNGKAAVRFEEPVAVRDGLLVISQSEKGTESAGFALSHIEGSRSFLGAGESATIDFPSKTFSRRPGFGTTVWCTSRHNQNLPLMNESIPSYKQSVDIDVRILPSAIEVRAMEHTKKYETEPLLEAQKPADIEMQLQEVFKASDRSLFTLGKLSVQNESGVKNPFLPISLLKRIRRAFYETLDAEFEKSLAENTTFNPQKDNSKGETQEKSLPKRSLLGLWNEAKDIEGTMYLSLSPLMFDEDGYFEKLDSIIASNEEKGEPNIVVGLNNIAQVEWAKRHPNVKVFADFFLYTYNGLSYEELKESLPNMVGSYETRKDTKYTYVGDDFGIPLFTSRVCLRRNSLGPLGNGLSCAGCTKDNTYRITQNGRRYRVRCKDCITTVTEETDTKVATTGHK